MLFDVLDALDCFSEPRPIVSQGFERDLIPFSASDYPRLP